MSAEAFDRRRFLVTSASGGAGLILGFYLPSKSRPGEAAPAVLPFAPNAFLSIDPQGVVTLTVHKSEMGQGVRTALPMMLAEELEADWSAVRIEQADGDLKYGEQITGGSSSVRTSWDPLRKAGATAREMLLTAAAEVWNVPKAECRAERGRVIHALTGRSLPYGELVGVAGRLPVPESVPLKRPEDFRILGRETARVDNAVIVEGKAIFGLDVRLPGMLYAAVVRAPVFGGKVQRFDASRAQSIPGVRQVFVIEGRTNPERLSSGVAVVGESTWAALSGAAALEVTWDDGAGAAESSEGLHTRFEELARAPGKEIRRVGDPPGALARAAKRIEAVYQAPFLAHAPMEPMNATADVGPERVDIWAGTQDPQRAQKAVAEVLQVPVESVRVHVTLLGSAFGRRHYPRCGAGGGSGFEGGWRPGQSGVDSRGRLTPRLLPAGYLPSPRGRA